MSDDANRSTQKQKALDFAALHTDPELLILPNVWDALGARMLMGLGFPAVATASAAVAFSHGYDDGENIPFPTLLQAVRNITRAVDVPVTVDLERGYADDLDTLRDNIRELIGAGGIGINLEDSLLEGGTLRPVQEQCDRIAAVRQTATQEGVPLFINARTDCFITSSLEHDTQLDHALERGRAYARAGASGLYPIGLADRDTLRAIRAGVELPINVYASPKAPDVATLQADGMARLSLGPGMLRAAFTTMHTVAREIREEGRAQTVFDAVKSDDIRKYLD